MQEIAKTLIIIGIIVAGLGVLLLIFNKVPLLGKMPGDIYIQKKNFTFYFPLMTSLLVSVIFSFLLWLISRR